MRVDQTIGTGDDAPERLAEITSGDLPTAVFDATGNAASMASAFHYVAPGGRLVLVGLVQADIAFHDPEFHRRELTLLASRNSTAADMTRIIALMEAGEVDTHPWITHRAPCGRLPEEFPRWLDPESRVVKAMVEFGDDESPEDSL